MARQLFIFDKELGKVVPVEAVESCQRVHVISDDMPPTIHHGLPPGAQRTFTSKSAFRRVTKELGLTELGNERPPKPASTIPKLDFRDIRERALAKIRT